MPTPSLIIQAQYAELLERVEAAAFEQAFPEPGNFVSKQVDGRTYWYFQAPREGDQPRAQRYAGPETPELKARIEAHRQQRASYKERRALVSSLVRQGRMPAPNPRMGQIVEALAHNGLFRLRAVLVGTLAYQCYPAMLGTRLPHALLATSDVDIAQFLSIPVATGDRMADPLSVLREVDPSFHPAPALQTQAQPLRFLDFLIYQAAPAVLLHGAGVLVNVPRPERFAVHKLILAPRRTAAAAKSAKDIQQASALLESLARSHPLDLREAWEEARDRGPSWRELLDVGWGQVPEAIRRQVQPVLGAA